MDAGRRNNVQGCSRNRSKKIFSDECDGAVIFDKLIFAQLAKKLPIFDDTQRSVTVF